MRSNAQERKDTMSSNGINYPRTPKFDAEREAEISTLSNNRRNRVIQFEKTHGRKLSAKEIRDYFSGRKTA